MLIPGVGYGRNAKIFLNNGVYTTFFPSGVPARRTVGVSALPKDALVQIDVVVSNAEGTPPKA